MAQFDLDTLLMHDVCLGRGVRLTLCSDLRGKSGWHGRSYAHGDEQTRPKHNENYCSATCEAPLPCALGQTVQEGLTKAEEHKISRTV